MKNKFLKIKAFLILSAFLVTDVLGAFALPVQAATSFLGKDDAVEAYTKITNSDKISDLNELDCYIFDPSKNINNAYTIMPVSKFGHGRATVTNSKIHAELTNRSADYDPEGVEVGIRSFNAPQYDTLLIDWNYYKRGMRNYPFIWCQDRKTGDTGLPCTHINDSVLMDADKGKNLELVDLLARDYEDDYWSIGMNSGSAPEEDGKDYAFDIYQIYARKGGIIVTVDPDNGEDPVMFFERQAKPGLFNRYCLDTVALNLIPQKEGFKFCGWNVEKTYYQYKGAELEHDVTFNSDGTKVLIDVIGERQFFRYYVTLKPIWKENAYSTLEIDNDNGTTNTYRKEYLNSINITKPTKTGYTITLKPNPVGNESITGYPSSLTTTKSFKDWEILNKPLHGIVDDVNLTTTKYTFLGTDDEAFKIKATYNDEPIDMPIPRNSKGYAFMGWYSEPVPYFTSTTMYDSYVDKQVAVGGAPAKFKNNMTLYAGWMKLELAYKKTGLTRDGKRNEVGLLSWNTVAKDSAIEYRVYTTKDSIATNDKNEARWSIKMPYGTDMNAWINRDHKRVSYGHDEFIAPATGYYTIIANGGNGGGGRGRSGGYGSRIIAKVYVRRGDKISYDVAQNGSYQDSGWSSGGYGGYRNSANGGSGKSTYYSCGGGEDVKGHGDSSADFRWWYNDGSGGFWRSIHASCHNDDHDGYDWWYYCPRCDMCKYAFCGYDGKGHYCSDRQHDIESAQGSAYHVHEKKIFPAGGGGGATTVYLNDELILAAAGGSGSSANSNGSAPSTGTTWESEAKWNAYRNGSNGSGDGVGGKGAGNGYSYVRKSKDVIVNNISGASDSGTGLSTTGGANPGVWVTYYDYTVKDGNTMEVESKDEANPDKIDKNKPADKGTIDIAHIDPDNITKYDFDFERPADNGTTHYYMVSMDARSSSSTTLQDSNVVSTHVISGIKEYYAITDNSPNTIVHINDSKAYPVTGDPVKDKVTGLKIDPNTRWVHIAPLDYAGNLGETAHYKVPMMSTVMCIDIDIVSGNELGRSIDPIQSECDARGYQMVGHFFYPGQTISAEAWGTDVSIDEYYKNYFYKTGSATTCKTPGNNLIVYRYFYPVDVWTTQLGITGTETTSHIGTTVSNIYKDPDTSHEHYAKTYFVKADTEYKLNHFSYIFDYKNEQGSGRIVAPNDYMINHGIYSYNGKDNSKMTIANGIPTGTLSEAPNYILNKRLRADANRTNNNNRFYYNIYSLLPAKSDNKLIEVIPEARVDYNSGKTPRTISSSVNTTNTDRSHNLYLMCDSVAPTIIVPDIWDPESDVYNPLITEKKTIKVKYVDYVRTVDPNNPEYGSGVKQGNIKVTLIQEQTDDGGPAIIRTYDDKTYSDIVTIKAIDFYKGEIDVVVDPQAYDDMSGFITIKIEIVDNVGNEVTKEFRILVMSLEAKLSNITLGRPDTNAFLQGEFGDIKIETNGFVDKVDIEFPEELDELAQNEKSNASVETEEGIEATWEQGRVLSDTYPRDNEGSPTRVLRDMQTKFWGSRNYLRIKKQGGMEWSSAQGKYVHSWLRHFFYAPIYARDDIYQVTVRASKQDIKPGNEDKVYSIEKVLDLKIGEEYLPENITHTIYDRINDN